MRYGLYLADLRREQNDSHGTINYALGLVGALSPLLPADEELHVLSNPSIWEELRAVGAISPSHVDIIAEPMNSATRLIHDHVRSSRWARERRLHLIHFPKGFTPMAKPHCPVVATLHDDIPVRLANGELGASGYPVKRSYFKWAALHTLRSADYILTVSAYSGQRLAALAGEKPPPIAVTHEGVTLPAQPFVPVEERHELILILGSTFPHKRSEEAILWAARFAQDHADSRLRVVVTGSLRPECERTCQALGVTRLRRVLTVHDLAQLLASSRALVFGSAYEGFGLPPVEAYALGTPATYQRIGAMAEVLSGFPGGHEQWTYDSFAAAMEAVLALGSEELCSLQARMRQRYRWSEVARRTLEVYRAVAASATSAAAPSGGR